MSDRTNREVLEGLFAGGKLQLSPEDEYNLRAEDYVMEMPQSGERIVGRDKMRAFQKAYPNPPQATIRRILGSDDLFIIEGKADYGNEISYVVNIVEFKNKKIVKETRYYASPFDPPKWREEWVEVIKE